MRNPLRFILRCSWNNERIPIESVSNIDDRSSLSLMDILLSVSSRLPSSLFLDNSENRNEKNFNEDAFLIYLRKAIGRNDWKSTTIRSLLGDDIKSGGSFLLTLSYNPPMSAVDSVEECSSTVASIQNPNASELLDESHASPMECDDTSTQYALNAEAKNSTNVAISLLLESNFDVDSIQCIRTIIKIIDNLLSNPGDLRVRSIRLQNPAFDRNVVSKKGGLDIIFAIGFKKLENESIANNIISSTDNAKSLKMDPNKENATRILYIRNLLLDALSNELQVPPAQMPKPMNMNSIVKTPADEEKSKTKSTSFDPYKTQSFNTQSASVGADPLSIAPDGSRKKKSITETKLEVLSQNRLKIEQKMLQDMGKNRCLAAFRPSEKIALLASSVSDDNVRGHNGGDGSILAARMKRMEEERKKREEGGFTTKAMRDLEKLKKTKVYSHAQLRICFPDGTWLSAKFLPGEKISDVKDLVRSAFSSSELQSSLDFNLYVSPPRYILPNQNTLREAGLVPAARVHVSWTGSLTPMSITGNSSGSYIKPELFKEVDGNASKPSLSCESYPKATSISTDSRNDPDALASAREEELTRRMLGKPKGFGTSFKSGNGNGTKNKKSSKAGPDIFKWLKK